MASSAQGLTLDKLKGALDVTDQQLNKTIKESDLFHVAECFETTDHYVEQLGLSPAEAGDVRDQRHRNGVQAGMTTALKFWRQRNPLSATFKNLLQIVLSLQRGDVAIRICKFTIDSTKPDVLGDHRISKYKKYLQSRYKIQISISATQWPPAPTKKVFKLAIIRKDEIERGEINDLFVQLTITGKVSDIIKQRFSIDIASIFSEIKHDERRFVLIEGAPGSGKSTLALHLCKEWARLKFYQDYDIVILVTLGDPRVQKSKCLADLLPCASKARATEVEEAMMDTLGEGVLLVLDGWDELPTDMPCDSIILKLVNPGKFQENPIPNASIIITSRPSSSSSLRTLVSLRVEILGFTPDELAEYFKECLKGDSQAVESLMERLRNSPVVEGSCYIPFIASTVAHLYISDKYKLPESNTEIFISLVLFFLSRYMQDRLGLHKKPESLQDLPQSVIELFSQLCSLAYHGVRYNKVTFTRNDFNHAGVPIQVCDIGLLQAAPSILANKEEYYYNYLHLSIQEFLAALYISQMSPCDQLAIFKEYFGNPRFDAVFQFYAGLTKFKVCRHLLGHWVESKTWFFLRAHEFPMISLLHCLYEAEDISLCTQVADLLEKITLSFRGVTLSPLNCLGIGYFVSAAVLTLDYMLRLDLQFCCINDQGCKYLSRGFHKALADCQSEMGGKINFDLGYNDVQEDGARHIAELAKSAVRSLSLSHNPIGNNGLNHLCYALSSSINLVCLDISACSIIISENTGPALSHLLTTSKSIKALNLSDNFCHDCHHFASGLVNNSSLITLRIGQCGLTDRTLEQLCTGLGNHLENLDIINNDSVTMMGIQCLARRSSTLVAMRYLATPTHLRSADANGLFKEVNEEREKNGLVKIRVM